MTDEKVELALEQFYKLSIEEKTAVIDFLTMTRQELTEFLGVKNHHIDTKYSGKLESLQFGIFLTSVAEKVKGENRVIPPEMKSKPKKVLKQIQQLTVEQQKAIIQKVTMTRAEVVKALSITSNTLNELLSKGKIHSVKRGLYLKDEVERRNREKLSKHTGLFTKEIIIASLQEAARNLGPSFTHEQYASWVKDQPDEHPSVPTIWHFFNGGFTEAMKAAELQPVYQRGMARNMDQKEKEEICVQALLQAARDTGVQVQKLSQPAYIEWRKENSSFPSFATIVNVLGGWKQGKAKVAESEKSL
ncbi:hypothetical protein [Brevibacillus brevis]|uniref:Helix-turn-helix domain-containing protein n=1 Tax=Brevibacillus brevis TaxID=1393 RepID=A0ABY9TDD6_BREBE|nr:hypothetical protein [Brevibacillus brevis]WNC17944.1 hypothetical protein RGB73_30275 [Brevibacillus brevis]